MNHRRDDNTHAHNRDRFQVPRHRSGRHRRWILMRSRQSPARTAPLQQGYSMFHRSIHLRTRSLTDSSVPLDTLRTNGKDIRHLPGSIRRHNRSAHPDNTPDRRDTDRLRDRSRYPHCQSERNSHQLGSTSCHRRDRRSGSIRRWPCRGHCRSSWRHTRRHPPMRSSAHRGSDRHRNTFPRTSDSAADNRLPEEGRWWDECELTGHLHARPLLPMCRSPGIRPERSVSKRRCPAAGQYDRSGRGP